MGTDVKHEGKNSNWTSILTVTETTSNSGFRLLICSSPLFIITKGLNSSFIQPENSKRTIQRGDNQSATPDEKNVKTEPPLKRPYFNQNNNFRTQIWDLYIDIKLLQPHQLRSTNNPNQSFHEHQQETNNNPTDLKNLYPQICLKTEGWMQWFQGNIEEFLSFLYWGFKERLKNLPDKLCCPVERWWLQN